MSKQSSACKSCMLRDENGICTPVNTPCKSVANSLCNPLKAALEVGKQTNPPEQRHWLEVTGTCPFCYGTPVVKKSNWFKRVILRKGPSIVCPDCRAKLVSVNNIFTSDVLVINRVDDNGDIIRFRDSASQLARQSTYYSLAAEDFCNEMNRLASLEPQSMLHAKSEIIEQMAEKEIRQ